MSDQTPVTTQNATPWFTGKASDELAGFFTMHGLTADPVEAAVKVAEMHRAAEKFIGVPTKQLVRIPENIGNPDAMRPIYQRFGMPNDAKDYDFTTVKGGDGKDVAPEFVEAMRQTAWNLNLPKDAAPMLAKAVLKHMETNGQTSQAERQVKAQAEIAELERSWGANKEANYIAARAAATTLGIKPEVLAALQGQAGYAGVMNMFLTLATKIGEDKFVSNDKGGPGIMTREMAMAEKKSLLADRDFVKKYRENGAAGREAQQILALDKIILGITE